MIVKEHINNLYVFALSIDIMDTELKEREEIFFDVLNDLEKVHKNCIFLCPEYMFSKRDKNNLLPLSWIEKNIYKKRIEKLANENLLIIPGTFLWEKNGVLYNTSLVFYRKVCLEIYKSTARKELYIARINGLRFIENFDTSSRIFKWNNYYIGVEICGEHEEGVLDYTLYGDRLLDIQIIISNGLKEFIYNSICVRDGGYVIMCEDKKYGTLKLLRYHGY